MAVLLIGYDVECTWKRGVTARSLDMIRQIHVEEKAPCTLFITGRSVARNRERCRNLAQIEWFDFQQHTYSHVALKSVIEKKGSRWRRVKAASPCKIRADVLKAAKTLRRNLDVESVGLTAPFGYSNGLKDRPDLVRILHESGIRFLRSYARNENGDQPVDFAIQPFWYGVIDEYDILEFPVQGWQDCLWREAHGWEDTRGFLALLKSNIDIIADRDLTWCCLLHDWSCIRCDPAMDVTRSLIRYAREKNVRITTYKRYYEEQLARAASN